MQLGVQYYRAPFPEKTYWADDFRRIRESGLNTVQLWILWSWVEATPGRFNFADYDELVELAQANGLSVVLSTIAEIQPHWIFREVHGAEMVDHMGQKVVSSLRGECNFGLTPGGCTDHPGVWNRMKHFIQECGRHFKDAPNLHGWDIWNELRWNVQADNLVCFCPHTMDAWRGWLVKHYGALEQLNDTWKRRYVDWADVLPGKLPDRPYSELMAWQRFISDRANAHGAMRYAAMREVDKVHPITAHAADPSPLYTGGQDSYALERGNDWGLARNLDGIGCSSFPQWQNIDDAAFGIRIEMVKSAANGKLVWLSELQGGRAAIGFNIYGDVTAVQQQHWLWNGIACGADVILFWCWRDEVFGRESGGFGLAGNDGRAEERLAAMRTTGQALRRYPDLLKSYQPEPTDTAIVFNPADYYLEWAQYGKAADLAASVLGYARALIRSSVPCQFVESSNLEGLSAFKLVILPHTLAVSDTQAECYLKFVREGGTLLCESECGAFTEQGFYLYPEKRFLAAAGIVEKGRRSLPDNNLMNVCFDSQSFELPVRQWLTPLDTGHCFSIVPYGKGKIIYLGSYAGSAYSENRNVGFEAFCGALLQQAACRVPARVVSPVPDGESFVYIRGGMSGNTRLLFVFFPEGWCECVLEFDEDMFCSGSASDLISGREFKIEPGPKRTMNLTANELGLAVLAEKI